MSQGHLLPTAYFENGRWILRERITNPEDGQRYRDLSWPSDFPESQLVRPEGQPGDIADFRLGDEIHRGVIREVYIRGGYAPRHLSWPEGLRARFLNNDKVTYIIHAEGELHRIWAKRIVRARSRRKPADAGRATNKKKDKKKSLWRGLFG